MRKSLLSNFLQFFICGACCFSAAYAETKPPVIDSAVLKSAVERHVGNPFRAGESYVVGDFNNDTLEDIAMAIYADEGREKLKDQPIFVFDSDGKKTDPVKTWGQNCLGLLIVMPKSKTWRDASDAKKFITYECFSALNKHEINKPVPGKKSLSLKGDGIVVDLESGAQEMVYWNGKTFLKQLLRQGD